MRSCGAPERAGIAPCRTFWLGRATCAAIPSRARGTAISARGFGRAEIEPRSARTVPEPRNLRACHTLPCDLGALKSAIVVPMIRDVDESNLAAVRAFLEKHLETSLFLLGNLDSRGPRRQPHPYSGNFRVIEEGGAVAGVFCLTNRGACLVQTGGRDDLGSLIVADC